MNPIDISQAETATAGLALATFAWVACSGNVSAPTISATTTAHFRTAVVIAFLLDRT